MEPCPEHASLGEDFSMSGLIQSFVTADRRIFIKQSEGIESGRDPNNVKLERLPGSLCSTNSKVLATSTQGAAAHNEVAAFSSSR